MPRIWLSSVIILLSVVLYTFFKISQFLLGQQVLVAAVLTFLLFIIMIGWEFLYRYDMSLANVGWFRTLAWIGSTLLGVWVSFILFSLMADLCRLVFWGITTLSHVISLNQVQSLFLSQRITLTLFIVSLLIAGLGLRTALSGPKVIEVFVPLDNRRAELTELKIVQISDLHVGPLIRHDYVAKVVQKVNELTPDIVVLTGDVADGDASVLTAQLQPLTKIKASLGKFYVTGNHEYYWGAEEWIKSMRYLGFIPLINGNCIVNFNHVKILIAGVTDISGGQFLALHSPEVERAIFSHEATDFKILLSHSPRVISQASQVGCDLQLSGHTHAGQFFPFNLLVPLAHKYHRGLNCQGKTWLYINSGTGSWGPVNRFGVHSEITIIRFKNRPIAP